MEYLQAVWNDATLQAFLSANADAFKGLTAGAVTHTAVGYSFAALAFSIVFCWVMQITTGYWSWVDRFWSLIPAVYAVIFAYVDLSNARLTLMATLAVVWAARLTFNFARKGGYHDLEDYRWSIIREFFKKNDPLHPVGQEVFHIFFVCIYQHVLLWLIVVPACYLAAASPSATLTTVEKCLGGLFLTLLAAETWTDETQWRFQSAKYALAEKDRAKAGGDIARGFCTTGPFAISRHLNFFSEQSMWWVFAAFSATAGKYELQANWSFFGAFLLTQLFLGSTWMTEKLSAAKYPAYAAYQQTTSRLVPWFPGTSLDSAEGQKLVKAALDAAAKKRK